MPDAKGQRWRRWLILPPILLGAAVLVWMVRSQEAPETAERDEPAQTVRVVEAREIALMPKAVGYGPVEPARIWDAVAQVAGRLVSVHPQLHDGEILEAGTELLRIDPADYELALAEARAQLAELAVEQSNAEASLAIEERGLKLAEEELQRLRTLAERGTASQSDVDQAERTALNLRTAVQNLRNSLTLIPAQREVLQSRVERAELDLERTRITAPFDLRVANLTIEADQYVGVGQTLFEGDSVDRVEIQAQVPMASLRRLFIERGPIELDPARLTAELPRRIGLAATVRLDLGDHIAEWSAEFVRFDDAIDPDTRTMGVVVAVERPFDKVIPGERPPLSKGMFVQVELRASSQRPMIVLPRSALRDGLVFVVDSEQRLERRPLEIAFAQGAFVAIADGLEVGEQIVLSDLVPAVSGMRLRAETDVEMAERLAALDASSAKGAETMRSGEAASEHAESGRDSAAEAPAPAADSAASSEDRAAEDTEPPQVKAASPSSP
ncbi:efflux RND transporter periplasmic adaptor subunit [Halochromatium salexigens]|uniref:Efflux transporter periplasmic adaptor subunit n=1 Tax=Halochromatium salexigens TaxID=49447 RepID=A0AAJ0UEZ0_HALSE|nr:efflux RND transporter periplasmic adaptor subunit [Halochromatium salexigens]MBK5930207.1 efflux transporter periplasmic adaptor subunit [Halochromatium salexigens]